jgi:WD40 repeat protein
MDDGAEPSAPDGDAPKAKVFISYSRQDIAFADRLAAELKARRYEPLIDRTEIYAFEDWWTRIQVLIARSDTVIFVLSPDAVASDICAKEVAFAASLNKRFAPVVCRRTDDGAVPETLRRLNFVFFDDGLQFAQSMQRLVEALDTDIAWVRKHTEFGEAARRWSQAGRPGARGLLLRSPVLDEAEHWIAARPRGAPPPTEATQAFIADSRKAATQRRNVLSASLGAGLVVALALAGLAYWQRGIAVQNETRAQRERDAALLTQSRFLASLADQRSADNDAESALLLALEAMPDAATGSERPYAPEAELALQKGWQKLRQLKVENLPDTEPPSRETIELAHVLAPHRYSPDGHSVDTSGNDAEIVERTSRTVLRVLRGHEERVLGSAFSNDGRRVLTWSADRTARIWDAATGASLQVLGGHDGDVTDAAFNANGSRVVTISANTVRIWDAATAKVIRVLRDVGEVHHAAFSPRGSRVLTISYQDIRIWDDGTGRLVKTLNDPSIERAIFSPDGTRVLSLPRAGLAPKATVWDVLTGEKLAAVEVDSTEFAAFSQDGAQVLILNGHALETWSIAPRNAGLTLAHPDDVYSGAFSPDETLAIAAGLGTVRIFDARTGALLHDLPVSQHAYIARAGFSPDGRTAFTRSEQGALWEVATGRPIAAFDEAPAEFSRLTGRLLTVASNGIVRLRDQHSGAAIVELPAGDNIKQAMFASDGRRILVAQENAVSLIDPDAGTTTRTIIPADDRVTLIAAFSADRRRALTWSQPQQAAHVWDLDSGRLLYQLAGFKGVIDGSGFSDDGRLLAVSSVSAVSTRIWDVAENRIIASRRGTHDAIRFSPDNRRLLVRATSSRAEVWDVATTKTVATLEHQGVEGTAWNRDGSRVMTAGRDHRARIWPTPATQALIDRAKADTARCLTVREREAAFLPSAPPAWCIELAKWPYRSADWMEWLKVRRHDPDVPLPGSKEWDARRVAGGAAAQ